MRTRRQKIQLELALEPVAKGEARSHRRGGRTRVRRSWVSVASASGLPDSPIAATNTRAGCGRPSARNRTVIPA